MKHNTSTFAQFLLRIKLGPFFKRLIIAYLVATVLLADYIWLHLPFSYIRPDTEGADTSISYRYDILAAWLIAILAGLIIGRVKTRRWLRPMLLLVSLVIICAFMLSSMELGHRRGDLPSAWFAWVDQNAWVDPFMGSDQVPKCPST